MSEAVSGEMFHCSLLAGCSALGSTADLSPNTSYFILQSLLECGVESQAQESVEPALTTEQHQALTTTMLRTVRLTCNYKHRRGLINTTVCY